MSSIRKEIIIHADACKVWEVVRDVGALHTRLVPGMVADTVLEDDCTVRVVTFGDGMVLRERIIAINDDERRLVWSVVGAPFEHHNATVEVIEEPTGCRMVWTADLLPEDLAQTVASIMDRGLRLSKQTLESGSEVSGPFVFHRSRKPMLHHISLFVSDIDASTKFYTEGLGMTLRESFDDIVGHRSSGDFAFGVASVFLEAGGDRYVELHTAGKAPMSDPSFPLNHLAFAVTDVNAAYNHAIDAGGKPFDIPIPNQHWDGSPLDVTMTGRHSESMRMAFLQGLDGELIELYQAATN